MKVALRLCLCVLVAAPVWASSALRVDFGQLTRAAQRVVGGRVVSITAERDAQNGYIFSTVTMAVTQAVPSQLAGRQYSFRMIGGELGSQVQYIADYPQFRVGDNVVLFLTGQTASVFGPTVALGQGVFFVESDPYSGIQHVTDQLHRPILAVRESKLVRGLARPKELSTAELTAGGKPRPGLRLDEFFREVRAYRAQGSPSGVIGR